MTSLEIGAEAATLPAPAQSYQLRLSRRAMACTFEVILNAGQYAGDTAAAMAALDVVDRLEDQLSIYREESEVSAINRTASLLGVPVEAGLFALLALAVEIHRATGGAYDVTSGRLSSVWGFTRRHGQIPAAQQLAEALQCVGSQHLALDRVASSVRFDRPGLEINLGSIGKGYALDRCAELLTAQGIDDFLLHGGSSSVLARGTQGPAASDAAGWWVGLRHPLYPARRLGRLRLADRSLGTSGSGTQFFLHQGRRYGHILDPRTGWPAEGVLTATALAPSAAEADALATAFYVLGPEAVEAYCASHPRVAAVLVTPAARSGAVDVHPFNLGDDDWNLLDDSDP